MFHIMKGQELDEKLLQKMLKRYRESVAPAIKKAQGYYDGEQAILKKAYADPTKPCSKTVTNYCKNIADTYRGYIASAGYITYRSNDDISELMDILQRNDYQTQDSDFCLNALVSGVAYELLYVDEAAQVRFRQIDPLQCFGVFDDSLDGNLLYFVRFYPVNEWDDLDTWQVDVYGQSMKRSYSMDGADGQLHFVGEEPHYFNGCPANVFMMPKEKPVFECIYSLQDSYNELLSSELDDYSAFCDAYLALTGVDADEEDVATMKENRVLLLPEGAMAQWLTKNANDAQVENILNRTHNDIYRIAQCPDLSAESFISGVSSGIAIKYRLTGIETRAAGIAAAMAEALRRRIELILGFASMKDGEELALDVRIDFARNIPEDLQSVVNVVTSLQGIVSEKTLLSLLPFVSDVDAEAEALAEQKRANVELFRLPLHDEGGEEEEA